MNAARVLANRSFRRLWIAQGLSVFGDYVAMFAVQAAIVFRMHGSPRDVGEMLLASLIPGIAMGPAAGVFADRWNPWRTMVTSDVVRAVLVALLFAAHSFSQMCVLCFAVGCVSAFFVSAQAVAIPLLVERGQLLAASALMQQTLQVARIASPAAAAALAARFGENACYGTDAASFVLSAVLLRATRCEIPKQRKKIAQPRVFREFREGIRALFAIPALSFATLSMAAGTFAAGCYSALAAIYVRDALGAGTALYGAMGSLTAIGTLAGAVMMGRIAHHPERESLLAGGMGLVGACILLLAVLPAIFVAMLAALGIGFGAAIALVSVSALMRERTPEEMRGRVSSVSLSLMSAAQASAILAAGIFAESIHGKLFGVRAIYACSGALLLAQPACRYVRRGMKRSGRRERLED